MKLVWITEKDQAEDMVYALQVINHITGNQEHSAWCYREEPNREDYVPIIQGEYTCGAFARILNQKKRAIILLDELKEWQNKIHILRNGFYELGGRVGAKKLPLGEVVVIIAKHDFYHYGIDPRGFIFLLSGRPIDFPKSNSPMCLAGKAYTAAYPDRREWSKLTKEDQEEWARMFATYDAVRDANDSYSAPLAQVRGELIGALAKFPEWTTDPIHAASVIAKEVGELQQKVNELCYEPHKTDIWEVRKEAAQVGAMAMRFLAGLRHYEWMPSPQHSQTEKPKHPPHLEACAKAIQDIALINANWFLKRASQMPIHACDPSECRIACAMLAAHVMLGGWIVDQVIEAISAGINHCGVKPAEFFCECETISQVHGDNAALNDKLVRLFGVRHASCGALFTSPNLIQETHRILDQLNQRVGELPKPKTQGQLFYEACGFYRDWVNLCQDHQVAYEEHAARYESTREAQHEK